MFNNGHSPFLFQISHESLYRFGIHGRKVAIDKLVFVPCTEGVCTGKGRQPFSAQIG